MTEHAAVIFVFFFLAEYGSILLMCILSSALFLGGYLTIFDIKYLYDIIDYLFNIKLVTNFEYNIDNFFINYSLNGLIYSLTLGIKSSILVFTFI
jgi:NADH-ubiquinone oxidoreductase chain 1